MKTDDDLAAIVAALSKIGNYLSRAKYESLCEEWHVDPMSDDDLIDSAGLAEGNFDYPFHTVDEVISSTLHQRRCLTITQKQISA